MFALAAYLASLTPIDLDSLPVEAARTLHGRHVLAGFRVAKQPYTLFGRTLVGAADRDDGAERGAVLAGNRLDLAVGRRAVVVGILRVIDHPPAAVGGVAVPGWTEVRVETN